MGGAFLSVVWPLEALQELGRKVRKAAPAAVIVTTQCQEYYCCEQSIVEGAARGQEIISKATGL